jgi:hypothetical protein
MKVGLGTSGISVQELKEKGFLGKIMYDILCFSTTGCRDKEAMMELLEFTAKDIISQVAKETSHDR